MGSGPVTHSDFLPRHLVEEHIASLLLFDTHLYRLGQRDVFREPHLEVGVESPIAIRSENSVIKSSLDTRVVLTVPWQRIPG